MSEERQRTRYDTSVAFTGKRRHIRVGPYFFDEVPPRTTWRWSYQAAPTAVRIEKMTDVVGSEKIIINDKELLEYNPVDHENRELSVDRCLLDIHWNAWVNGSYPCTFFWQSEAWPGANWYPTLQAIHPSYFQPPNAAELTSAFADMMSDMSLLSLPTVSIPNMLLELKDMRRVVDLFTVHRPIAQEVSDKYLGVSFGILPLISDLSKIVELALNLDIFLDRWNEQADKAAILRKRKTISVDSEVVDYVHNLAFGEYTEDQYCAGAIAAIKKVGVNFIPHRLDESLRFKLKLKAYGFDNPLGIIWEAVPFSWVIDYFTNIGDIIDAWERSPNLLEYTILGGGYSVKTFGQAEAGCKVTFHKSVPDQGPASMFFNTVTTSENIQNYIREPLDNFPTTANAESFKFELTAGAKQFSYIGAVGLQMAYRK